jgi:hypothetical protein
MAVPGMQRVLRGWLSATALNLPYGHNKSILVHEIILAPGRS